MSHDADLQDCAARSWCTWEDRLATLHVAGDEDHGGADVTDELLVQATDNFAG